MNAAERAKERHVYENGPRSFREDLEAHLINGIVFSTPTAFVMARYVSHSWPASSIINPWLNDATCAQLDTLHVYLAAGDLSEFFTFPHKPCKWIAFERRNILKFYPYERIQKLIRQGAGPSEVPAGTEGRETTEEHPAASTSA